MKTSFASMTLGLAFAIAQISCSESTPGVPKATDTNSDVQAKSASVATPNVSILRWGPQTTKAGAGFAVQKNGNSALWFEQRGIENNADVEIWFDTTRLPGTIVKANEVITVEVPAQLISRPGVFSIYMTLQSSGRRIDVGSFEVLP
jgi:hypothetical protein